MTTFKQLNVIKHVSNIFDATQVQEVPLKEPGADEVRLKVLYVGVNLCDLMTARGLLFASDTLPHGIGIEALGQVDKIGSNVNSLKVGSYGVLLNFGNGTYAEYIYVKPDQVVSVKEPKPEYLGLASAGVVALLAFRQGVQTKPKETLLVTAAAGNTGQMVVQIAKTLDLHVIGLCSTKEKVDFLTELGCDRVINSSQEDLDEILGRCYPKGIDIVWDTVLGESFPIFFKHLAVRGRLMGIGGASSYAVDQMPKPVQINAVDILMKEIHIFGFRIDVRPEHHASHMKELIEMLDKKQVRVHCDDGSKDGGKPFEGLEDVPRAVDYLYSRKSIGKVMVSLM